MLCRDVGQMGSETGVGGGVLGFMIARFGSKWKETHSKKRQQAVVMGKHVCNGLCVMGCHKYWITTEHESERRHLAHLQGSQKGMLFNEMLKRFVRGPSDQKFVTPQV